MTTLYPLGANGLFGFFRKGVLCLFLGALGIPHAAAQLPSLEQARNGTSDAPISAVDWVSTTITAQNGHYVEHSSVPYRLIFDNLLPGAHRAIIAWDTKTGGRHATDYLTHYNRLQPHNQFGAHNVPEVIQPLRDISGGANGPSTFPIPAPNLPQSSFHGLPANQRVFHIYNGTITAATYVAEGDLANASAESRIAIDFVVNDTPVVIFFGGHLATKAEWGAGDTAAGVLGAAYRMRLVELDGLPSLLNVTVSAPAVVAPPTCNISGPSPVCPATTNSYNAVSDASAASFIWSLTENTAGASIIGPNIGPVVQVHSGSGAGAYTLQVAITQGQLHSACTHRVQVLTNVNTTPLGNTAVCPGGTAMFSTEPAGTGPFSFVWRKGAQILPGETNSRLVLSNVTAATGGVYCVEVSGPCNSVTSCAVLTVHSNTTATPLANLGRCVNDGAVFATTAGGTGPFSYRWRHDGALIAGQTNRIYSQPNLTTSDAGTYTVEVTGLCNSVTNSAVLTVHTRPTCGIGGPDTICPRSSGTVFTAPAGMAAYQWRLTGNGGIVGPTNQQTVLVSSAGAGFLTLNLTVINSNDCTRSCSRTINVGDLQPPVIVCAGNIQTNTEPGRCSRAVEFAVSATDNCQTPLVVCNPPAGGQFPKGTTTVNCTATDDSGNQAACSFDITVVDLEAPALGCPANLVVNTQPGLCEAKVTYNVSVSDNCPGSSLICSPPSGAVFPLGTSSVTCRGSDAAGNIEFCSFDVMVVDNEGPQITCSPDLTLFADAGQCDVIVDYEAQATDNCAMSTIVCTPPSGSLFSQGITMVVCVATDVNNNRSHCSFQVEVYDGENPRIVCPGDISVMAEAGRCDALVNFTLKASDNCREVTTTCVPPAGAAFPVGQTNVICTATDSSGNTASCTFKVTVSDNQRPILNCPMDLVVNTETGRCDAVVQYTADVTNNCPGARAECAPASGSVFSLGSTMVNCFAMDASSNVVSCAFNVVVQDGELPRVSCPGNIVTDTATGECVAFVAYDISATDNCPGVELFCEPESGAAFLPGETPVYCVAVDTSGNALECAFSVRVNDNEQPVISCPADVTMSTAAGRCDAVASFAATATDNCGSVQVSCAPPSGSIFPKGTNLVSCSAQDPSGNTAACAFRIIVQDRETPAVVCPANIVTGSEPGRCDAVVTFAAVMSDNCPSAIVACSPPSSSRFPVGLTTVSCVGTDASGNTNRCSFTVTVQDQQKPVIACPANILKATEPGRCDALVTFSANGSDNCAVASVTCVPASGTRFAKGTTAVVCTARDSSGNEEGCSFNVTVNDSEPPAITCPPNQIVAAELGGCDALASFAPAFSDNCPGASSVCLPPSGTRFVVGQTPVTCAATDASGNTNRCSFIVTVEDRERPVIACPANISTATEPGRCDALVTFSANASDNCAVASVTCVPASGTRFAKGTTPVVCTARDSSGHEEGCSFNVTVNDGEAPAITCPTNQIVAAELGRCDALVSFAAVFNDNCPGVTLACSPPSGTHFVVGQTAVTCVATDASGNTNRCSFTVTVQDQQKPVIACPANILRATEPGRCDALVTFSANASDNCALASIICVPGSGTRFAKGTTAVVCTARDNSGNEQGCSFNVTVNDSQPPAITCPTNQIVAAESGRCDALASFAPAFSDNCPGATIVCSPPSGGRFAVGQNVVTCVATDVSGNTNRCSFLVRVNDLEQPSIICPADITTATGPGRCDAEVIFNATASDNCPGVMFQCVPPSGSVFPSGATVVACTATDASGNAAACAFTVRVTDNQPPLVTCPTNIVVNTSAGRCDAVVSYVTSVTDNCGATVVCAPPSGATFAKGLTIVNCTATDANSNTNGCSFTVTVQDRERPVITCPEPQEVFTESGHCDAAATFAASATDNCAGVSVTCAPSSGSRFARGVTTVTCTATDASSNTETCSFTVTVRDIQPPVLTCPANIVAATDPGRCDALISFAPTAQDPCGGVAVVCAPPSGTRFARGTTMVSCTATDASSNTVTCGFTVRVEDRENPQLVCPANVVTNTAPGRCDAMVTFQPAASDNCALADLYCEPASGSVFPLGTNVVVCTAIDSSGNQNTCAFSVAVLDRENPAVVCSGSISVNTEPGRCDRLITFGASASDNCSQVAAVCNPPSGTRFNRGVTSVLCTATDASGNSGSCSFSVTVSDHELPALTCPQDLVLNTEPGMCSVRASFSAQVNDNCPGASVQCMPASGSEFPVGTTTVVCQGADASGNARWCAFDVHVNDAEPPRLTCPGDLIVNTEPTQCSATVAYSVSGQDACSLTNLICTPPSGSIFTKGATLVQCNARDASGNETTCAFSVSVRDAEPPSLSCPTNIVVPADLGRCAAVVEFEASSSDNCAGSDVVCTPPPGSTFAAGLTFVVCTAMDAAGNTNQCSFSVRVVDSQRPVLTCPGNLLVSCETSRCDAIVTFAASATDNCGAMSSACVPPSGTRFGVGSSPVQCSAIDAAGNVGNCSFTVTVRDNENPVVQCPGNIVASAPAGRCDAIINFNASASDNCSSVSAACFPPSGSAFPIGITTVTCSAVDGNANPGSCQFTVTVRDLESPALQCPADMYVNAITGRCDAVVSFSTQASDNCPSLNVTCTPPSGTTFFKGTNFITCTARDASSNSVNCTFRVVVRDVEKPLITCPSDRVVSAESSQCRARVTYSAAATDNCPGVTVVCNPPSNSFFNKGVTTVLCVATDASGNTNRCSFSVTVNDTTPPTITCPANISTNAPGGQVSRVVHFAAVVSDNCPGATYVCTPQSGSLFPPGATLVTCTATDASGNNQLCSFTVTVNDTEPPVINCPTNLIVPTAPGRCDALCTYTVTASDNSGSPAVVCVPPSGSILPKGLTNVLCTATDGASNSVSCGFSISVVDLEKPVLACPTNMVVNGDPGRCDARAFYKTNSATDNCGATSVTCNPPSGAIFPKGTNTVTCTATDSSGNTQACAFTVEVMDNERPSIGCPVNLALVLPQGQCEMTVNFNASVVDNCPGATVSCVPPSGSAFSKGLAPVNCTARDTSGNTSTCSFLVEVRDQESPTITCPSDFNMPSYPGACGAPVGYSITVHDNCPGATVSCTPPSGSTMPLGTNTVICTGIDASGNTAGCSFRVIVRDVQLPVLTCPSDIVIDGTSGNCAPVANYSPTISDNCPGTTVTCVPPSGSTFPQGTNHVQCTGVDASGNTAACAFSVIVRLQPLTATPLESQTRCAGQTAAFTTFANGSGPLTFTWMKNGTVMPGQTATSLMLSNLSVADSATYAVAVRGPCGALTNSGTLLVNAPVVANGLTNVTRCDCDPLVLVPTVSGTGPFQYLWRKNGSVLPGATSNTLGFAKLSTSDAGVYTVEVSGACNTAVAGATVTVISVPNPAVYTNSVAITINDLAPAFPYPSSVRVTCVPKPLKRATVTLRGFSHAYPDDVDALLVAPDGQCVMLISDAGDGSLANNVNITLDDASVITVPDIGQLSNGTFRPANYEAELDAFPQPAPKSAPANALSALAGTAANGFWSLFVVDDFQLDSGVINNGWVLRLYWESNPGRLTNPRCLGDGTFQMTLIGDPQSTHVIEASSDMQTWTPIATVTLTGTQADFTDPNPAAVRFYRATQP